MYMIVALVKRNLLRFFRSKMTVFFSLLSVLILIMLYLVFLAEAQTTTIVDMVEKNSGGALSVTKKQASDFVNTWLFSGIMLTAIVNAVLTSTQFYVKDIERGISKDIILTPLPKLRLTASYMISTFLICGILSAVIYSTYVGLLFIMRVPFMGIGNLLLSQAVLHLTVFAFTTLIIFCVSFIRTTSTLSAVCTITGVFTGFFAGIYLPIGSFPTLMQDILNLLPFSHAAALFRSVLMQGSLQNIYVTAELGEALSGYFGVELTLFGAKVSPLASAIYILVMGITFFALSLPRLTKKL